MSDYESVPIRLDDISNDGGGLVGTTGSIPRLGLTTRQLIWLAYIITDTAFGLVGICLDVILCTTCFELQSVPSNAEHILQIYRCISASRRT